MDSSGNQDGNSRRIGVRNCSMSTLTKTLIEEIKTAPEAVQQEVLDFLRFQKARRKAQGEGVEDLLPLAQTAWAADWSTPEEEAAWRDL